MNDYLISLMFKFLKFGLIGLSGLVIDFAITYGLKEKLATNKYIANSIGFVIAASSNYIFNRIWTFNNVNPDISFQYMKFISISIVGLSLSTILMGLFHEKMKYNFYCSKLIAIGIVLLWNFTANFLFTFSRS